MPVGSNPLGVFPNSGGRNPSSSGLAGYHPGP
jgi:hypothetical protein